MTPTQQFILELLKEGKGYVQQLAPVLIALIAGIHAPQPKYMQKKIESKEEG
jgi:hypothetical protein